MTARVARSASTTPLAVYRWTNHAAITPAPRQCRTLESSHGVRKIAPDRHAAEMRPFGAPGRHQAVANDARRADVSRETRVHGAQLLDFVHRGEINLLLRVEAGA